MGSSISLLSPGRFSQPRCAVTPRVFAVFAVSEMPLLFAAGTSPTFEPPPRRTWLGATRPRWLVTGPCRTPSAGSSGTPASRGAPAWDRGTPGGPRSEPGQRRRGGIAAARPGRAALAALCPPLLQTRLRSSVKGKNQTPCAPELCKMADTFLWRGKLVTHVALC